MVQPNATELHVAAIYNAAWMVRHYARGGRATDQTSHLALKRRAAIYDLGLVVRSAFNQSEDFEPLLAAVADGLRPKDDPPF